MGAVETGAVAVADDMTGLSRGHGTKGAEINRMTPGLEGGIEGWRGFGRVGG